MVKAKKSVKKIFYDVDVPLISTKISLYGESADVLVGKVAKVDLTRSLKGKSFEIKFKIGMEKDKLVGNPESLELAGSFVRRMMRKGVDYVEDSFVLMCKDVNVVVKPFLITRNRVSRAVRKALREETKKFIESNFKARTSREIFSEILANKVQKELSYKLKKIYPLALCEIRVFKIVEKSKRNEKSVVESASSAAAALVSV